MPFVFLLGKGGYSTIFHVLTKQGLTPAAVPGLVVEGRGQVIKNPAELPASRPNSGAGTEKRPM